MRDRLTKRSPQLLKVESCMKGTWHGCSSWSENCLASVVVKHVERLKDMHQTTILCRGSSSGFYVDLGESAKVGPQSWASSVEELAGEFPGPRYGAAQAYEVFFEQWCELRSTRLKTLILDIRGSGFEVLVSALDSPALLLRLVSARFFLRLEGLRLWKKLLMPQRVRVLTSARVL